MPYIYNKPWTRQAAAWKNKQSSDKCPMDIKEGELIAKVDALTKRVDYLDSLVEELIEELEAGGKCGWIINFKWLYNLTSFTDTEEYSDEDTDDGEEDDMEEPDSQLESSRLLKACTDSQPSK